MAQNASFLALIAKLGLQRPPKKFSRVQFYDFLSVNLFFEREIPENKFTHLLHDFVKGREIHGLKRG